MMKGRTIVKKIAALFAILICCYGIYYDLTIGTLPTHSQATTTYIEPEQDLRLVDDPYTMIDISPGDTVLSIYEKLIDGPLPVPIDEIVADFSMLNNGIEPEEIQIGKTYKFMLYND